MAQRAVGQRGRTALVSADMSYSAPSRFVSEARLRRRLRSSGVAPEVDSTTATCSELAML